MDPNVTYKIWFKALLEEDTDTAIEAYQNLAEWLDKGGFEPSWGNHGRKQFYTFDVNTGYLSK